MKQRAAMVLAFVLALVGLVVASPGVASASVPAGTCGSTLVEFTPGSEYWDNGSYVVGTGHSWTLPPQVSGCHNIWMGQVDVCGDYRVVRLSPLPEWDESWQYTCNTGAGGSGYTQHAGYYSSALQLGYGIIFQKCLLDCPHGTQGSFNTGWAVI